MKGIICFAALLVVLIATPCLADKFYETRFDASAYAEVSGDDVFEDFFEGLSEEQADDLEGALIRISFAASDGEDIMEVLDGKTPAEIVEYSERPEVQEAYEENRALFMKELIEEIVEEAFERQRKIEKWAPIVGVILLPIFTAVALLIGVKVTGNDATYLSLVLISYVSIIFWFIPGVGWLLSGLVLWILLCRVSTAEAREGLFIVLLTCLISMSILFVVVSRA